MFCSEYKYEEQRCCTWILTHIIKEGPQGRTDIVITAVYELDSLGYLVVRRKINWWRRKQPRSTDGGGGVHSIYLTQTSATKNISP